MTIPRPGIAARPRRLFTVLIAVSMAASHLLGCKSSPPKPRSAASHPAESVVIYCSVDPDFAEPILDDFHRRTGLEVHHIFDTEAGKTTGLVNKLLAEKSGPRADVWWSGEIFGTIQLATAGILDVYRPSTAIDIPENYRDPGGMWTAGGLRARVIGYDPTRTQATDVPTRWADLMHSKFKNRIRMADPRFGTTRGHMATLLALWGEPAMRTFYQRLRDNGCVLTDGNSQSILHVTRGLADFGATDTDDVLVAKSQGVHVDMAYPDLDVPDGKKIPGTLWIPCSVALVRGAPHPNAARRLVDFLASADVEEKLHASASGNIPVRPDLRRKLRIVTNSEAAVDYNDIARSLEKSDRLVTEVLLK